MCSPRCIAEAAPIITSQTNRIARHFLQAVDAGQPEIAQHDLHEHRGGHHREDQAAEMAERVVEARAHRWRGGAPSAVCSVAEPVPATRYFVFRM